MISKTPSACSASPRENLFSPRGLFREGLFSRGGAGIAENFLKMTEIQGFAIPDSQSFRSNFGFQVCAGESGVHAGESPAGRIRRFTTESDVRNEAARPKPQAGHRLNQQAITKVNLIQ